MGWVGMHDHATTEQHSLGGTPIITHLPRGVGYDCVNTARGDLSSLGIVVDGCRAGNHPMVNRLLRGVFHLRPPTPRYSDTWLPPITSL
ncbi:hypothetical protein E2C01_037895 [Portunus trituberculatus]|uniref:Uncharacterized protein n=1 Tax=Portunus trituberculatus TaxID=210409 RepID=A0A5B7FH22_PORTR|nr:hypothetical protein [Portunus trituberculatus]